MQSPSNSNSILHAGIEYELVAPADIRLFLGKCAWFTDGLGGLQAFGTIVQVDDNTARNSYYYVCIEESSGHKSSWAVNVVPKMSPCGGGEWSIYVSKEDFLRVYEQHGGTTEPPHIVADNVKNNDGRTACAWCGKPTKEWIGATHIHRVCTDAKCGR